MLADARRDAAARPDLQRPGTRRGPARPHPRRAGRPALAQGGEAYREGRAWWRSERRIRAAAGARVGIAHVPDAELHWPSLDGSPYAGQIWAIEAELTPKPLARTVGIMRAMLTRTSDYGPSDPAGLDARYAQIVYLTAPAAISIVTRAIGALPPPLQHRMVARDLPPGAVR